MLASLCNRAGPTARGCLRRKGQDRHVVIWTYREDYEGGEGKGMEGSGDAAVPGELLNEIIRLNSQRNRNNPLTP